ncbi:MAG TPA: GspE/PulE family protein [Gemmataceae bacterium]|jgi:type II secretory ATPase GspE/PulE/Tfp pilus assembly ATPase PilB-like protein
MRAGHFHFLSSLGVLGVLAVSPLFAAEESFTRGPGLYFHPAKLIFLVLLYFAWLRTCRWVSSDCHLMKMESDTWNPILLLCGVVGLVAVWLFPIFALGFLVFLVLYLAPTLSYVSLRNEKATQDQKVLTPQHIRKLLRTWLRLDLGEPNEPRLRPIPVRFIGKSTQESPDEARRVARLQDSKGYRAALELIADAIEKRATDIHLEPTKEEMIVRFRIDGILEASNPFARPTGDAVINIFKVLADLDITEKRKPQDGSFAAEVNSPVEPSESSKPKKKASKDGNGEEDEPMKEPEYQRRQVDFRVATAGSVVGEKLVLRILDPARQVVSLERVGMRDSLRKLIRATVTQPHGLFIVCGPTGAGKSTTLYACLGEIDRFQKNVITIENPVEYHIDNVTQIEINPKAGKTFATELRSILRQDPDVIYIGEIRDQETAEIACQAAQTGHMVFTTLHANDTVTAVARLVDLGVQPFMVANALSAVLGQRLVRVLCPNCKQRYKPNADLLRKANLPADKIKYFYRPPEQKPDDDHMCPVCMGTGYRGRTGVFEMLEIGDSIREMIRENPNFVAIRNEAVKQGMKHLQEDGLRLVIEGRTSVQELLRVCK